MTIFRYIINGISFFFLGALTAGPAAAAIAWASPGGWAVWRVFITAGVLGGTISAICRVVTIHDHSIESSNMW